MLEKLQNLIYPQKCGICGKAICEIEENKNPYMDFCELISIFQYDGIVRERILDYKFNEKSYLYKTFVNFLLKHVSVKTVSKSLS